MSTQPPLDGLPPTVAAEDIAAIYQPFAKGLTRCAVVVDTRNMHGQARRVFGRGLRPSAHGIRLALREYGFDAVEVYAGVATKTMATSPSDRVRAAVEDNKRYAVELAREDAVVLAGHLAERGGEMEEKQVDVLLALKVADLADRARQLSAPFECIVVLSEDMDLMPSYEFGNQRGVPVYAAAFDTIHTRDDQRKWLILDEVSLRRICPPPAHIALGAPMRSLIARIATTPAPVQAPVWKVETWNHAKREIILSNSKGITGILKERRNSIRVNERHFLYATGIEMEPKSRRFPLLTLGRSRPQHHHFEGVDFGHVLYWVEPTRAKIRIEDSQETATITASPGQLLPGQRIAVFREATGDRTATYYVGPLEESPPTDGWPLPETIGVVTITGDEHRSKVWRCAVDGLDTPVLVPKEHLKHATVGDRLRVALAGQFPTGEPLGQPLTCCLPHGRGEESDKLGAGT
ncbi:hypothetical protein [Nocardioides taihuensis]|uniref:NYN domain-containing protein n=1 Tax=Nocardioides taihuensis TaxID=1835606 RepID=A0ABW0BEB0_9ACTN